MNFEGTPMSWRSLGRHVSPEFMAWEMKTLHRRYLSMSKSLIDIHPITFFVPTFIYLSDCIVCPLPHCPFSVFSEVGQFWNTLLCTLIVFPWVQSNCLAW